MKTPDARKILSELKDVHGFVSADDEKTLDLISKMAAGKPDVRADARFLENLRSRLLLEAAEGAASPAWRTWRSFAKFLSVPVALAGIAAIAGTLGFFDVTKAPGHLAVPAGTQMPVSTDAPKETTTTQKSDVGADLAMIDAAKNPSQPTETSRLPSLKGASETKPVTAPESAAKTEKAEESPATDRTLESVDSGIANIVGDSAESAKTDTPMADSMGFSAPMAATAPAGGNALKMGVPSNVPVTEYRYSYSGTLPTVTNPMDVYERTAKTPLPTFSKAADMGMAVSADPDNGYVTVMRDYDKWPETPCTAETCGKILKESDVPDDSVIVSIAESFAKDLGIDLSGYGKARVDSSWKTALSQTSDPSFKIVPENLTVVFPRKVGGYEILDDSGYPAGITFIVNHPTKRVQQAIGIEVSTLSSVDKVSKIDAADVTSRLANGGSAEAPVSESGATVVEIPMSRATLGYSLQYAEKNGKWVEFYAPSVVFETDKTTKSGEYFKTRVVVPLADVAKK